MESGLSSKFALSKSLPFKISSDIEHNNLGWSTNLLFKQLGLFHVSRKPINHKTLSALSFGCHCSLQELYNLFIWNQESLFHHFEELHSPCTSRKNFSSKKVTT